MRSSFHWNEGSIGSIKKYINICRLPNFISNTRDEAIARSIKNLEGNGRLPTFSLKLSFYGVLGTEKTLTPNINLG